MTIDFRISVEDEFLKVDSFGSCEDFYQLQEYVLAIHQAAVSNSRTKVIVNESQLEYKLTTVETFGSGRFVSRIAPREVKIAVVCKLEGWNNTKFWETVAVNRGVMVKIFIDQDKAEKWLTE